MMKSDLAPAFKARMLGLSGWYSTNILGNRDGEVLDDPESFKTKEESKLGLLEHILQPDLYPELYGKVYHKVRINYYPPRGDNKEGWDNIDIFGWLGYPMQIKVDFLCRDSILAAPIVLDLALFFDLAGRAGLAGIQEWLSFYFKSPQTAPGLYPEHDLFIQQTKLKNTELIYETWKTYRLTQGRFLLILWVFIGAIVAVYFGTLAQTVTAAGVTVRGFPAMKVLVILLFSLIGIAGSYGVAWFGIRVNTFANSRTAFASLTGKPYPNHAIPLKAGMSIGMLLISVELLLMLLILLFIPGDYAGPCFIGFAIGESLCAAVLRLPGGIFTKIADIGADLMKIVFKIKEDDARNPGVIADCSGDNAGDSVGPSADGFETYGVTGVALISFILLAVNNDLVKVELLVW